MKGKFRILGRIGLGVFMVCALMVAFLPVAPVAANGTEVTDVWVDFPMAETPNKISATTNTYIIHFKPHTALVRGVDYVTVTFPDGSTAMGPAAFTITAANIGHDEVLFSTDYGTTQIDTASWFRVSGSSNALVAGGYRVKARLPIDVADGQDVWVKFAPDGIEAAATEASTYKVYVATTKDTKRVLSSAFALGDSVVTATAMEDNYPVAPTAGTAAAYIIKFTPTATVSSGGTVVVKFPVGATLPSEGTTIAATDVSFLKTGGSYTPCGESPTVNPNTRELRAKTQIELTQDIVCYIKIEVGADIRNPTRAATTNDYYVMVRTSEDGQYDKANADYSITATSASKVLVANGEIGLDTVKPYSDDATMIHMYSHQIYITLADKYGNAKYPDSEVILDLTPGTGGQFFKTASDTTGAQAMSSVDTVTIGAPDPETNAQIVYYKNTTAGSYTLKVTDSGGTYTEAEWTFTVCGGVSVIDSSGTTIKTYAPTSTAPAAETASISVGSTLRSKYGVDYINDAIDGAMAGDTVQVGDYTYELDTAITLNKKITLTSVNGALKTTIRNTADVDRAVVVTANGDSTYPVIIDGLTFQRLRSGEDITGGIYNNGYDYMTVQNCIFNYLMPDGNSENEAAIWVRQVTNAITSCTISDNTFNHCGDSSSTWPNGTSAGSGKGGIIVAIAQDTACHAISGLTISGNTMNESIGYGIQLKGSDPEENGTTYDETVSASVTNNTIIKGMSPIAIDDWMASLSITGNTITDSYNVSIKVSGANNACSIVIKSNTITGCAQDQRGALRIERKPSASHTHYVQYNDIYDNYCPYAIYIDSTDTIAITNINCNYNWFGDASGPAYTAVTGATVTKSNPNGTGDAITDRVFYYPWLYKSKADVVTKNVSYQTSTMKLVAGWNTLSTPVPLIESADAIDELISEDYWSVGYWYDAFDADGDEVYWEQITTGYVLSPCDAVYVKMDESKYVQLKFDAEPFSTPSKKLAVEWNLISLASLDSNGMDADDAVASVLKTPGNLPGYAQVISPSLNATQTDMYYNTGTSWTHSTGQSESGGTVFASLGYWIYMENACTLVGFEITPIAPDLD